MTLPAELMTLVGAVNAVVLGGVQSLMAWEAGLPGGLGACAVFCALTLWAAVGVPGASVLILAVGAVYGVWWGTLIVSVASTVGATIAFSLARRGLREPLRRRHARHLAQMDRLLVQRGPWVLLLLRTAPVIPFPLLNPMMGLTTMRVVPFCAWSYLGMLGGTALWVLVGQGLAQAGLAVVEDVRVWALLGLLVALAVGARRLSRRWRLTQAVVEHPLARSTEAT